MGRFTDWLRPPPVVAAATTITDPRELDSILGGSARDITAAWKVWREVGEIHYATTQQARLVSRVGWDFHVDGVQADEDEAARVLEEAFGNQLHDLAKQGALHLQVAGGYILARWPGDMRRGGPWDVVSLAPDYKQKELLRKADVRVHVTNPDPVDPTRTDSPVIAAIDVARELILARAQSRAAARNRTAQHGLFFYPLEGAGQDPEGFKKKLQAVITAPLADELSSAGVVPNLVGFPGDWIDKVKNIQIGPPLDEKLFLRVEALVKQIAMILDSPPEILLGMGDVNHWSSWAIQEDNWFGHTEPLASRVGEGFAEAMAFAADLDSDRLMVTPDPSPVLQRRPAITDVATAYTNNVVTAEYYRAQLGADEDDAPDAPPEVSEPPPVDEETSEDPSGDEVAPVLRPVAAAVAQRLPSAARLQAIDSQAYDSVGDLITDAAERALERLGAKLRSMAQGSGIDLPTDKTNAEIAAAYKGDIPGADEAVAAVAVAWATKVDRVVRRAYKQLHDAGVELPPDDNAITDASQVFAAAVGAQVAVRRGGGTGDAELWTNTRRVVSIAGLNPDPAPPVQGVGGGRRQINSVGVGIALGETAINFVRDNYQAVVGAYTWVHVDGKDPHPVHVELDGRTFNGEYLLEEGINWFPGDHAGCECVALPKFVRVERTAA